MISSAVNDTDSKKPPNDSLDTRFILKTAREQSSNNAVVKLTRGSDGLFGLLHRPGQKTVTLDEMDEAITAMVIERHKPKNSIWP